MESVGREVIGLELELGAVVVHSRAEVYDACDVAVEHPGACAQHHAQWLWQRSKVLHRRETREQDRTARFLTKAPDDSMEGLAPLRAGGELRGVVHAESDDDQIRGCTLEPWEELELDLELETITRPRADETERLPANGAGERFREPTRELAAQRVLVSTRADAGNGGLADEVERESTCIGRILGSTRSRVRRRRARQKGSRSSSLYRLAEKYGQGQKAGPPDRVVAERHRWEYSVACPVAEPFAKTTRKGVRAPNVWRNIEGSQPPQAPQQEV